MSGSVRLNSCRYFCSYLRGDHGHGYHPFNLELGLTTERTWFLRSAQSTEVIEQTVLGLGTRPAQRFEQAPLPEQDGEFWIIQAASKAMRS